MVEERRVPDPVEDNPERIQSRPYEGFATFPDEEVDRIPAPGAGPRGALDSGPRLPVVVVGVGILVLFSVFLFDSPWPLAIGLVLLVAGAIWAGLSSGEGNDASG